MKPAWVPADWPVSTEQLQVDHLHPLLCVVVGPKVGEQPHRDALMREIARHIDARPMDARVGALYHVADGSYGTDLLLRLKSVLAARREKMAATTVCLCYVTKSPLARAALRTIMSLAGLPYPAHVVDSVHKAMQTFKRAGLPIDVEAHTAEYEARFKA